MKKVIGNLFYLIIAISGVFQFFLLSGVIWNIAFPILQILIIFIGLKIFKNNKVIRISSFVIIFIFLFEILFSLYSNTNIKSGNINTELKVMSYNLFFKNRRKINFINKNGKSRYISCPRTNTKLGFKN